MTLERKKEIIYVCAAFTTAACGLTWVQMAYNEPSMVKAWDWMEWKVVISISAFYVLNSTLITWLAYMSDPSGRTSRSQVVVPPTLPTETKNESEIENANKNSTGGGSPPDVPAGPTGQP